MPPAKEGGDLGCQHIKGASLYTAFCVAFAGYLCVCDFIYSAEDDKDPEFVKWFLIHRSIAFYGEHLKLSLFASKLNPFRQGVTILATSLPGPPDTTRRHNIRPIKRLLTPVNYVSTPNRVVRAGMYKGLLGALIP